MPFFKLRYKSPKQNFLKAVNIYDSFMMYIISAEWAPLNWNCIGDMHQERAATLLSWQGVVITVDSSFTGS
jgi:hypothetical protein